MNNNEEKINEIIKTVKYCTSNHLKIISYIELEIKELKVKINALEEKAKFLIHDQAMRIDMIDNELNCMIDKNTDDSNYYLTEEDAIIKSFN